MCQLRLDGGMLPSLPVILDESGIVASATIEVDYRGRLESAGWVEEDGDGIVQMMLGFKADSIGHFLILFKDDQGQLFSASDGSTDRTSGFPRNALDTLAALNFSCGRWVNARSTTTATRSQASCRGPTRCVTPAATSSSIEPADTGATY
jgi:hypothetical protein